MNLDSVNISTYKIETAEYLQELYENDHTAFMQLYLRFSEQQNYSLPVLHAIMLHHGEGQEHIAEIKQLILKLLADSRDFANDFDISKALSGEYLRDGYKGSVFKFPYGGDIRTYNYMNYASLYYYDAEIRNLFNFFWAYTTLTGYYNSFRVILDCFLIVQVQYFRFTPYEAIDALLHEKVISIDNLFMSYCCDVFWDNDIHFNSQVITNYVKQYTAEALHFFELLTDKEDAMIIKWLDMVYYVTDITDCTPLVYLLSHKSSRIRKKCKEIVLQHEDKIRVAIDLEVKDNAANISLLNDILYIWNDKKYTKGFVFDNLSEFCKTELNKNKKKAKLLSWIPDSLVEEAAGNNPEVLQFFILSYLQLEEPMRLQVCDRIAEQFGADKLSTFVQQLYEYWIATGSDVKYKMIVVPYAIYGPLNALQVLTDQIAAFMKSSRTALATLMMKAIYLNGNRESVHIIANMATYNEWTGAVESFDMIAVEKGVSKDELSDHVVPTLGFDSDGYKTIHYGTDSITFKILPDFTIGIVDNGKVIKNLPKNLPPDVLSKAKNDLSALKKELQPILKKQKSRLIESLMNGRSWLYDDWLNVFALHPFMKYFADKLLWCTHSVDGQLLLLTYNTENGFHTLQNEPVTLAENAQISVMHSIDDKDAFDWYAVQKVNVNMQKLYNILSMPLTPLLANEVANNKVLRYKNIVVDKKVDYVDIVDKEYYKYVIFWDIHGIYFRNEYLDIEALLRSPNISKMYEDTVFRELVFYRYSDRKRFDYEYMKDEYLLDPFTLPQRFVNSVVSICNQLIIKN